MASRIYPEYDDVRTETISGVHPSVKEVYAKLYGSEKSANSVPLNSQHPRFYLELTENGDYFIATAKRNSEYFDGFGQQLNTSTHSLLKLEGSVDEVVCKCLQVKIESMRT